MTIKNLFCIRAKKHVRRTWRGILEDTRVLVSLSLKLILVLTDGVTKERCIAASLFWKACRRIARGSGYLHLTLYLKQSRVVLQRYVSGDTIPTKLSPAVSLTRTGLPRIIPSFHRRKIRAGCATTIQLYMSLFSVGRIIPLAKKVTYGTFESIVTPIDPSKNVKAVSRNIVSALKGLLNRYVPGVDQMALNHAIRFVPTWKSTFRTAYSLQKWDWHSSSGLSEASDGKKSIALTYSEELEIARLRASVDLWTAFDIMPFQGKENDKIIASLPQMEDIKARVRAYHRGGPPRHPSGRLCQVLSGDGKRRLFCIGNYFVQRMLHPLHEWLMLVLKRIPMDGTFNQPAPFNRLIGLKGTIYSVDLKAATDRWPFEYQIDFISKLFGDRYGNLVRDALGNHAFQVDFLKSGVIAVQFAAGQPLGYLSSWPLFSLTHHYVIWWLAEQLYPGKVFRRYAILGDDIVIADTRLYNAYRVLLDSLGVEVSLPKTLTSPTGCAEFAKRFRLRNLTVDVSPVSLRDLVLTYQPLGWYSVVNTLRARFSLRYSTYLRLAGLGFRAASRNHLSKGNGRRAIRVGVMLLHMRAKEFGLHALLSCHLGRVIEPSVIGVLYWKLKDAFRPRDLEAPKLPSYISDEDGLCTELTLYREWLLSYLKYIRWHALLDSNFQGSLDIFFDAPFYKTNLYVESVAKDTPIVDRFGVWLRLYDWARRVKPLRLLSGVSNLTHSFKLHYPLTFKFRND